MALSTQPNGARRRYGRRIALCMGFYAVAVAFISGWLGWEPPREGPVILLLALLPPLGIGGWIWSMGRYLDEEEDEFVRMLQVRAAVAAIGVTLFVVTAWGFLAEYAHVWSLPLYLVAPLFCGALCLVQPFIRRAYR